MFTLIIGPTAQISLVKDIICLCLVSFLMSIAKTVKLIFERYLLISYQFAYVQFIHCALYLKFQFQNVLFYLLFHGLTQSFGIMRPVLVS